MAWTSILRTVAISTISVLLAGGCWPAMTRRTRQPDEEFHRSDRDRQAAQDADELAEIDKMHQEYLRLCPDPPEEFLTAMQCREPYVGMSFAELIVAMGARPAEADCHRTVLSDGTHDYWTYVVKHYADGHVPHRWHFLCVYLDDGVVTAYRIEPQSEIGRTPVGPPIQPDDIRPSGQVVAQRGRPTDE